MARPIEAVTRPTTATVTVSDSAARQVAKLLAEDDKPNQALRVAVLGGGCSGFQYRFSFEDSRNPDDLVIEKGGIIVLVDPVSAGYMAGAEIDYVEDMIGASFQVKNPNAVSSCGCGTSFSLG